jgi:hypothetical protein
MAKKSVAISPITGSWHIVSMSGWEEETLNEEVPAFIEFDEEGMGKFQFGYVRGFMDHYRTKKRDRMPVAQFNWHGEDGADDTSLNGVGWVILDGGELTGTICIHLGDDFAFVAKRVTAKKAAKRT